MKKLLIPIILIVFIPGCLKEKSPGQAHYDLELSLFPGRQHIAVSGTWEIPVDSATGKIDFYLHKQLGIEELFINGRDNYLLSAGESDNRYMPDAIKYSIETEDLLKGTVIISFNYSGTITEWHDMLANVIGEEWTEMGLYFPWYPYSNDYSPFTYEVKVLTEGDYHTVMMGHETSDDYYAIFRKETPTNDMVVCASKDLKTISKKISRYNFRLAYCSMSDELTDTLIMDVERILRLFDNWFSAGNNTICIVESMREKGGGYARLGGIFLPGFTESDYFESRKAYTRYLAHEISHLWWYRANTNTWEDWLNEGFAEYSALMVLRELHGQEYFDEWIARKEKSAEGLGPVWQTDRNGEQAYTILYDKAPLLIHELEGRIGADSLKKLMWDLNNKEVRTTAEFMDMLENREGKETAEWFLKRLKS
ncbi:MAG: M1 family aminopeptidase [Bacteroidales bacterium]|nr:M1 family aminopeptidase [Bacteroidales bacterium]